MFPIRSPSSLAVRVQFVRWKPKDAVTVVTGASSGIGRSLCELLAKRGANVIAVARRAERIESLRALSDRVIPVVGDITQPKVRDQIADVARSLPADATNGPAGAVDLLVNNAGIGAAMVPLMTLGIPGDTVTALLLGGFLIHGIQPGPMLFQTNGELVYAIFLALLLANVMMLFVEYFGIRVFVKILSVPKHVLLSIVMVMCVVGAFALNNRLFDVYTLIAFGAFGYVMLKFRYPFPPLILGFILGPLIEQNMRSALMSTRGSFLPFFERPLSAAFLLLAMAFVCITVWRAVGRRRSKL